jgi:AraC-like DNA-binding protein
VSDVLGALRVTGSLLLSEEYAPPWGIAVPSQPDLRRLLSVAPATRVLPFHLVTRGAFEVSSRGRSPVVVRAGELAVISGGEAHLISEGHRPRPLALAEALRTSGERSADGAGASTAMVCGVFLMDDARFNPLFRSLPPLLHVPVSGPRASWTTRGVAELLVAEIAERRGGRAWVLARLLELLCAEAVLWAAGDAGVGARWLGAVRDPGIGAALDAFHRAPGAPWTVPALACHAALSPSRFAARFRELLGESPMSYCATWRLDVAARMLRESGDRVDAIARRVGYQSLPAFSRAFKRQWGAGPAALRKALQERRDGAR